MAKIFKIPRDEAKYEQIRQQADISATSQEIDDSVLFKRAENYIIRVYPTAVNTTDPNREQIELALIFLTASYYLSGGGKTGTSTKTASSGLETRTTIGPFSNAQRPASTSSSSTSNIGSSDRASFLEQQALEILKEIGVSDTEVSGGGIRSRLGRSRINYD